MEKITEATVVKFLDVSKDVASKIVALIDGTDCPEMYESVENWVRQCYNEPSRHEKVFCALDELLEGFGVEAVWNIDSELQPLFAYINMGDTYAPTICFREGEFVLSDWGTMVETLETEGIMAK